MRIVYLIDHLRGDGTQQALSQLVYGLGLRGHQQVVICLNRSWDVRVVDAMTQAGAEVRFVGRRALAVGWGVGRIWNWLRRGRFDVAVTFLFYSDVLGRWLAHQAAVPRIVSSIRARNILYRGWQRWLVRWTMRWVDAVVLNSRQVRAFAQQEEGANPARILVIPNGVDARRFSPHGGTQLLVDRRRQLNLPPGTLVLGSVGRLDPQKGFDILLKALTWLPGEVQLVLLGLGPAEVHLRQMVAEMALVKRVHFVGYQDETLSWLHSFDVYVQPSRFEGMPNALMEAMAAGLPVVASRVDGCLELLPDERFGWLVSPEDPAALAEGLRAALGDPEEAAQRGQAARMHVEQHFGLQQMLDAWERVLAGEHHPPSQAGRFPDIY